MMVFDAATLSTLNATREVGIRAGGDNTRAVIIWVVVTNDAVFVRSVRGPRGKWYLAARDSGRAILEVGGRQLPVRASPVADPAMVEAVSQAFLAKYATSPYAQSIVTPATLPTTLRLDLAE
jgi:hypothetical protein